MPFDVSTKDCSQLTDSELAEMADLCAETPSHYEIGDLSKQAEAWVLVTQVREGELLRGFSFSTLERIGGTPAIIKLQQGTQGIGTMIAETPQAVSSLLETLWAMGQDIVLQEYIQESKGRDVRTIVVGGRVVFGVRSREPDLRSFLKGRSTSTKGPSCFANVAASRRAASSLSSRTVSTQRVSAQFADSTSSCFSNACRRTWSSAFSCSRSRATKASTTSGS